MQTNQRTILVILIALLGLTAAGLVVTTEWGARTVSQSSAPSNVTQSPVNLQQFHNKYYLPNQSYLVIVGDFDPDKMKELRT